MSGGTVSTWTMDGFLDWTFGTRTLERVTDLVRQASRRLNDLRRLPDSRERRQGVAGLLRRISEEAEDRLWHAEADEAGALARLLASQHWDGEQAVRTERGFDRLQGLITARVARFETLRHAGAAAAAGEDR